MSGHTPGPWRASKAGNDAGQFIVSSEATGATVAVTYQDNDGADARLVAAAPNLLAACERLELHADDPQPEDWAILRAAIAEAGGA